MNDYLLGTNVNTEDLKKIKGLIERVYSDLNTKMIEVQKRRIKLNSSWAGKDANNLAPKLDSIFVQYQDFANKYASFLTSINNMIQNYENEEQDYLSVIDNYSNPEPDKDDDQYNFNLFW